MPTYEYECQACGERFELFQSITAAPVKKCTACGRPKARRLVGTGGGILFKGSGFYLTDYRSESYKQAAKAEREAASGGKKEASSDGSRTAASSADGKSRSAEAKRKAG